MSATPLKTRLLVVTLLIFIIAWQMILNLLLCEYEVGEGSQGHSCTYLYLGAI